MKTDLSKYKTSNGNRARTAFLVACATLLLMTSAARLRAADVDVSKLKSFGAMGQEQWPWAKERLTAATALELKKEPGIGRYLIFFHGESQRETGPGTHGCGSLGIAWTRDFKTWEWPGQQTRQ